MDMDSRTRRTVYPENSSADDKVNKVIETLSTDMPLQVLEEFSNFFTRCTFLLPCANWAECN